MTLAFASMDEYYIQRTTKLRAKLDRMEAEVLGMELQSDTLLSIVRYVNRNLSRLNSLPIFYGSPKIIAEQTVETLEELIEKAPEEEIIIKPEIIIPEIVIEEVIKADSYLTDYKDALNKFYYQRYSEAIEIFERLLLEKPKHELAGNVQYWVGESYYALRQYKKAYNAFTMVFNTNAFDKYDDTQLKLGFCYFKMGKMKAAVQEFQNLITYYPNSEHVAVAIRQIGIVQQYAK
ncbi:MAG: tetratricopeptide repeat protein [Methanomicrobiales archaeon]|nr:tetratricopeptide repeat protein [Methanomicrobiales archaeon]